MITVLKRIGAAGFTSAALFMGLATPASAQPIVTGGLVNVTIVDVLNNNTVTVPVAVGLNLAANVCDYLLERDPDGDDQPAGPLKPHPTNQTHASARSGGRWHVLNDQRNHSAAAPEAVASHSGSPVASGSLA